MKRFACLLSISFLLFACSTENEDLSHEDLSFNLEETTSLKYDGEIFRFTDTDDFLKFYNQLANLETNEFNAFLKIKGDNNSSFYRNLFNNEVIANDEIVSDEMIEGINNSELVISEFLSTIFNYEDKIMIGDDVVSLNSQGQFIIESGTNKNEIIGFVNNIMLASNEVLNRHNVNYTKYWTITNGDKRVTLSIFNESFYINNQLSSSNIYYRVHQERKSCSFWRCTWKDDAIGAQFNPNLSGFGTCNFTPIQNLIETTNSAVFTKRISYYSFQGPCSTSTYYINGSFTYTRTGYTTTFNNLTYDFNPF